MRLDNEVRSWRSEVDLDCVNYLDFVSLYQEIKCVRAVLNELGFLTEGVSFCCNHKPEHILH